MIKQLYLDTCCFLLCSLTGMCDEDEGEYKRDREADWQRFMRRNNGTQSAAGGKHANRKINCKVLACIIMD